MATTVTNHTWLTSLTLSPWLTLTCPAGTLEVSTHTTTHQGSGEELWEEEKREGLEEEQEEGWSRNGGCQSMY